VNNIPISELLQNINVRVFSLHEEIRRLKKKTPKWHDLRENPNDLPPVASGTVSIDVLTNYGRIAYYYYTESMWFDTHDDEIDPPPKAWCEIPKFEEKSMKNTVMNRMNRFRSGDIVRHFKRTMLTEQELKDNPTAYLYEIIGYGKHTATGEEYVVYKALYSLRDVHVGEIYIRPKDMFESLVDEKKYPNAKQLYRFEVV
jgi:hypothetical protein